MKTTSNGSQIKSHLSPTTYEFLADNDQWKDYVEHFWKVLHTRCTSRIPIDEFSIEMLQKRNLLLGEGQEEVTAIWKELNDRCPVVEGTRTASAMHAIKEKEFQFSAPDDTSVPNTNICFAYAPKNGFEIAKYER